MDFDVTVKDRRGIGHERLCAGQVGLRGVLSHKKLHEDTEGLAQIIGHLRIRQTVHQAARQSRWLFYR